MVFFRSRSIRGEEKGKRGACLGGRKAGSASSLLYNRRSASEDEDSSLAAAAPGGNFDRRRGALRDSSDWKSEREDQERSFTRFFSLPSDRKESKRGHVKLLSMLTKKCYNVKPIKGR